MKPHPVDGRSSSETSADTFQLLHSRLGTSTNELSTSTARLLLAEGVTAAVLYDALLELLEDDLGAVPEPRRPARRVAANSRLRHLVHALWADGVPPRRARALLYCHAPSARAIMAAHLLELSGIEAMLLGRGDFPLVTELIDLVGGSVHLLVEEGLLTDASTRPAALRCLRDVEESGRAVSVVVLSAAAAGPGDHRSSSPHTSVSTLTELAAVIGAIAANPLTPREREVLQQVAEGRSNESIARNLDLSVSTVKTYLGRVHAKLGSVDRASAIAICFKNGWIP